MEIRYNLPPAFLQVYKRDLERVVERLVRDGHNRIHQVPIRPRDATEEIGPLEFKSVTLRSDLTKYRYIPAILVISAQDAESRKIIEAEDAKIVKEQRDRKGIWPAWIRAHD